MSGEELPAVTLARIEGKLDLINASLAQINARGDDHETRIRALESPDARVDPARIKALEDRPIGITPAKFLSTLVGFGSLAAAAAAVVTSLAR